MHDRDLAAAIAHSAHEVTQGLESALVEVRHAAAQFALRGVHHADAHLDRDRHAHRRAHCGHALANPRGLQHQAGAEGAAGDAVARTTAVQVDLVVACLLAGTCRRRELARLAPAQLQRDRVLRRFERQQPRAVAVHDRRRGDHLGVQQHVGREAAQKVAAMAVGPIHHRSDRDPAVDLFRAFIVRNTYFCRHFCTGRFWAIFGHQGEFSKQTDGTTRYTAIVRIRRGGAILHRESRTFAHRSAALSWAKHREVALEDPSALTRVQQGAPTLAELIRWYVDIFESISKWQRSKQAHLEFLERHALGKFNALTLTSAELIDHVRSRRAQGAGPATVANDLIWTGVVLRAAKSVKGLLVRPEIVQEAREACSEL